MNSSKMNTGKRAAGFFAADLIESNMIIGIGTGSTVAFFIDKLGQRCRLGLKIKGVATSQNTQALAEKMGIPMVDPNTVSKLDIDVDGADEIDEQRRMLKGGGGALLREKIVAAMSQEMIAIVDESKCVKNLGKFPLPVEIATFAPQATIAHLKAKGFQGHLRKKKSQSLFITDNGNYIFDIILNSCLKDPESTDKSIRSIPGVIETGLFLRPAKKVIIGFSDGNVAVD